MKQAFKYLFLATALSLGFAACQEEPKEDPAVFSISADAQFTNSIATVTVSADKALGSDANVALVLESKSTLPDAALAFNDKAIIKKGAKEASITVTLDDAQLRPGTYEAVFTAKVDGEAVPGEAKVSATVLAPGITISADEALTEGKAKIKVTASKTVVEPIEVALALAATNTVPKDNATVPEKITVAAGQTEATAEIAVNLETLPYGEFVFAVTATAGEAAQTFTYQVKKELPAITAAGILALTPTTDQQEAAFVGGIKDLVVTYKAPTGDVYAKDATGYLYIFGDKTLKVGDVINGEVSGKVLTYYGVHEIKSFDYSKATVTNGTAPEPEAITIADIVKNFDAKEGAYVKLTGVINEADIVKSDKGTNNNISQGDDKIVLYIQKNADIATVEAGSSFDVTGIVTLYKKDNNVTKEVKIWDQSGISNVKEPVKVLTVERVGGMYPTNKWPTNIGLVANADRTAAMDEQYIYVANVGADKCGIKAISLADPTKVTDVNVTGVDGGYFKTSCVRTIYNPSTKKHILLASSMAMEADQKLVIYAWENGINNAPTVLVTMNNAAKRRFGDFFTIEGNWEKGQLWFRNFYNGTVEDGCNVTGAFPIANGKITQTWMNGFRLGYGGSVGMGSLYIYPGSGYGMLVTDAIGMIFDVNNGPGGIEWSNGKDVSYYKRIFGVTPFEYNGEKYIAYIKMGKYTGEDNAARSRLKIIKDLGTGDKFMQSITDDDIKFEFPIQIGIDNPTAADFDKVCEGATYSGNTMANLSVIPIGNAVYIMAHHQNVGISVFKMYMKVQ